MQAYDANSCLHEIAINAVLNDHHREINYRFSEHGRITELYPERIKQFGLALYYVKEMNVEPTATIFTKWCKTVSTIMNDSLEWEELQKKF